MELLLITSGSYQERSSCEDGIAVDCFGKREKSG